MNILWKEVAEAHHQQDINRVKMLYQRASRVLFFIGAFLAGGLQPLASDILKLSVGQAYVNGSLIMAILFLYPVHQSIGQINGMLMLATGKTKEYSIISVFTMTLSFLVLYIMLAPASMPVPGLGLGALGLALKQVGVQFIAVNIFGLIIARIFGWKFDWLYQILLISGCLLLGWMSHYITFEIWGESGFLLARVVFMAALYLLLVGLSLYLFPGALTISRDELILFLRNLFVNFSRAINMFVKIKN